MPKFEDVRRVLLIGSGPIVIGQAAEFDYSGTQACRSLREVGVEVFVLNSNPATIQTDTDIADGVYIEPITPEVAARIIEREGIDGILSGMGGQTALNICAELAESGFLEEHGVRLLGPDVETIKTCESREAFRKKMLELGEPVPRSAICTSAAEAVSLCDQVGYPLIVRPSYTLGGFGSAIVRSPDEAEKGVSKGMRFSKIGQVLIEEWLEGWKEIEYEVMRDHQGNCICICNMENIDPMGVHTGESIVVAPALTLPEEVHQRLRSAALRIIDSLGVVGGCNIQFAVHPTTWEYRVIEVNPRVSRSSALASKATGYPIARIAAKLAVGFSLSEIENPVTGETCAFFEPMMDYVVVKIPRWPFDKFPEADRVLTSQMKSTGEVMAIGRDFREAMAKAIDSLELRHVDDDMDSLASLRTPTDRRLWQVMRALRNGASTEEVSGAAGWDPFFVKHIRAILQDREGRKGPGAYSMVDTCAAEFAARTPYYYSTARRIPSRMRMDGRKVMVVGAGPIRIGQGIEFDYCCVHCVLTLEEMGIRSIVVNSNPETVSTDFDMSARLYFEPLTPEHIENILLTEEPDGVILQFGGQTSVSLARALESFIAREGLRTEILGTPPDSMDMAEDRERFSELLRTLRIKQPPGTAGRSVDDIMGFVQEYGYPVLVRPSYVLGGRGMKIVHTREELLTYFRTAARVSEEHPVLVDRYIPGTELDVDAVSDGSRLLIGGIMEQIEEAGVHSGDSCCVLPPRSLDEAHIEEILDITRSLCMNMDIKGIVNIQMVVDGDDVYVIEVNPRASRTVPFVSKATGTSLVRLATRAALGEPLPSEGLLKPELKYVKVPVFSRTHLPGAPAVPGPEMVSTGEVMGTGTTYEEALLKAMTSAGVRHVNKVYVHGDAASLPLRRLQESGITFTEELTEDVSLVLNPAGDSALAERCSTLGIPVICNTRLAQAYLEALASCRDFDIYCMRRGAHTALHQR